MVTLFYLFFAEIMLKEFSFCSLFQKLFRLKHQHCPSNISINVSIKLTKDAVKFITLRLYKCNEGML